MTRYRNHDGFVAGIVALYTSRTSCLYVLLPDYSYWNWIRQLEMLGANSGRVVFVVAARVIFADFRGGSCQLCYAALLQTYCCGMVLTRFREEILPGIPRVVGEFELSEVVANHSSGEDSQVENTAAKGHVRIHRRQFVIGPRPVESLSGWVSLQLHGFGYLSFCPELRVSQTTDAKPGAV